MKRRKTSVVVDAWVCPAPPKIGSEQELVRWVGEMMLRTRPAVSGQRGRK